MDLKSVMSRVSGGSKKTSSKEENFLAVKISSSEVFSAVWSISDGSVAIGPMGEEKRNSDDYQDLLAATDKAISMSLGDTDLPGAKTIFGVSPDWIVDGRIVEEKLSLLKRLCKELDLRPLGYILLNEAIENYLKEIEGAPLTAILIGLDGESGWVTLYRAGKNLGTIPLASGEDLNKRIETALGGFTHIEVLPARMILYDGRRDLKVLEEKIMAYPWSKQLPFLHFPKVEILNSEAVTKSVAIAGGTQMGGKIDLSEGIEIIETKRLASSEPVVVEDVGTQQEEVMLENEITPELEEIGAEEAGFVQEGNIGKLREMEEISPPPAVSLPKISHKFDFKSVLPKIKIPNFRFNLPNVSHGALILIPIILLILGGIGAFLYFIPKAKVYVYVTPQDFNKEMVSTVSGQTVDVTEIGSKKGVATGKKLVGEKAHGTVTIYSSSVSKTFVAGTTFTAANGLKFSLTSDVAIASGSGAASQVTATGNLTAVDIGDNYNLPSGTLFTIGGFPSSSYQAKNDSSFSGGNSHEATVVTKLDQDRLLATLSAELTATAKNDLNSKLMVGQTLLPNAITSTVSKKRFSKDVDTEAETFSVDLTIDFKGITVSSDDLISQFVEKYSVDIPKGYSLDRTSANPQINSVKMDKAGNAMLSVSLRSKLLPQLNVPDLRDRIAGRSSKTAGEVITKETGVSRVVIEAEPKFFQKLLEFFLPFKPENISLEIVSE